MTFFPNSCWLSLRFLAKRDQSDKRSTRCLLWGMGGGEGVSGLWLKPQYQCKGSFSVFRCSPRGRPEATQKTYLPLFRKPDESPRGGGASPFLWRNYKLIRPRPAATSHPFWGKREGGGEIAYINFSREAERLSRGNPTEGGVFFFPSPLFPSHQQAAICLWCRHCGLN